mgnify:CR=1 FL=1
MLSDKNTNDEEKSKFIEKVALENVDINALSLYTLGELRKTADKDSLAKYQKTFEKKLHSRYQICIRNRTCTREVARSHAIIRFRRRV